MSPERTFEVGGRGGERTRTSFLGSVHVSVHDYVQVNDNENGNDNDNDNGGGGLWLACSGRGALGRKLRHAVPRRGQ